MRGDRAIFQVVGCWKMSIKMIMQNYFGYVIKPIMVVDFDNPNSTGSLESETAILT